MPGDLDGYLVTLDDLMPLRGNLEFALSTLFIPLGIFKYWDWVVETITVVLAGLVCRLNLPNRADYNIILPVGISFFTFKLHLILSTFVEMGKKKTIHGDLSPFGILSATYCWSDRSSARTTSTTEETLLLERNDLGEALFRITKGLVKKLVFADLLYHSIIEQTFADPMTYRGIELWVALYAYTIWIYYDFSAYTDIAIGSAKLFGITLPENFNRPYQASSVAEFWRKWHITLSNWVRDYIYFPLGGTRTDKAWKAYRNIIITMVVIGIWHGASWNFCDLRHPPWFCCVD